MSGKVQIHGKQYKTVALRVSEFREDHQDLSIQTEIVKDDGSIVIMKASILHFDNVMATGFAEEIRGATQINTTSALENCETSAIGRALAAFGYGGEEYASANEVTQAILQQKVKEAEDRYLWRAKIVRENFESIMVVKASLLQMDYSTAAEAILELNKETLEALRCAPTKGGVFTTKEVEQMKSNEYSDARNELTGFNNGE